MSAAPGTIIMMTRQYSSCSIGPRNCAPFARNSPTVASCRRTSTRSSGDAGSRRFGLPIRVRRLHAHLARPRFENEPIVIEILGDVTAMNWEMISAVGQMLGAVGVIISIVYLAAQIRNQNKESRRAAM